jgi:hypothetical protein
MANFTPSKNIDRKKINKFFLIANFLLIFLISIVVLIYYNQTLKPTKPGAAQKRCREIDNQRECNASCSPPKANNLAYKCKWLSAQNKCIESGKVCGSDITPISGGQCPFPPGLPPVCMTGTCCVPGETSTGNPACIGRGPRMTVCAPGYECHWGIGCFPKENTKNPTNTPIPTKTPTPTPTRIVVSNTPTPTPTIIISDTPTPISTDTPIPTNIPTTPPNQPTNTPGPTATETPSPSPTEIILVANNNTPTSLPITDTPIQEIVQAGDRRSFLILSIPISLIILSLFL